MPTKSEPDTQVDRHFGEPITTLERVRSDHNVVAAVTDLGAARSLVVDLEKAGIAPQKISLLGAWPIESKPAPPNRVLARSAIGLLQGAVAGLVIGVISLRTTRRVVLLGASFVGGLVGAAIAASASIGQSGAWRQSLAADGSGTVAVGVHSTDVLDVVTAEGVMHRRSPLSINRFEGESRLGGRK